MNASHFKDFFGSYLTLMRTFFFFFYKLLPFVISGTLFRVIQRVVKRPDLAQFLFERFHTGKRFSISITCQQNSNKQGEFRS